ncbi:MAG: DUF4404 family protein [Chlorobiaceae bacterium]
MEQQKLREQLEALHKELEQVTSLDETTRAVLSSLREDIAKLGVDRPATAGEKESLVERLNEAVTHFEDGHSKLSMTIQHVLESLARMGF